MRTGRTFPCLSCVLALNCLQNSMMLIPFEPKAGPIGGAGLACPPLHWSLTKPVTSFAIFLFFGVNVLQYLLEDSQFPSRNFIGLIKNFFGSAKVRESW